MLDALDCRSRPLYKRQEKRNKKREGAPAKDDGKQGCAPDKLEQYVL